MTDLPNYIEHAPLGEDHLQGKAHDRLAKAIGDHLKRSDEKVRLIGLEGRWGSGKSNLLKILEDNILHDTHTFFTFDLWGNQNDNLRTVFLKDLLSFLLEQNAINPKPSDDMVVDGELIQGGWIERLQYLLAQKKHSERQEVPKIHPLAVLIAVAVGLSPFMKPVINHLSAIPGFNGILTGVFVSLLLFILIYLTLGFLTQNLNRGRNNDLASFFYIFKGKKVDSTIIESIRNHQPTVMDFRNMMNSVSKNLKTDLVIVYDNMDRMRSADVKSIWSSIHTFFAESGGYAKIWVIVAFDRRHIMDSFASITTEQSSEKSKRNL